MCRDKKWDQIRAFLDSDSNNKKEKKRQFVCYRGSGGGWTCLHYWAWCCSELPTDIIRLLIDIGGKELVMMTSYSMRTALHNACLYGASFDVIKTLIDVGGTEMVVAKDEDGDTGLDTLCYEINKHDDVAIKIKLMLQVPGTEIILTERNYDGETPLDIATANGASDEIKALLQPRTIKNEAANDTDDTSNIVPDDLDNDTVTSTSTTRLQDRLQAAEQKISDLESQVETQKTEHQKTIADLETEIFLLSEQNAKQDKDNTYWKDRVDNLTTLCSERKAELQQLQDSTRGLSLAHAKRERDIDGDDESDVANQSRVSKRSRIGSTANDMHDEEDDADEAIIQDLLH